MLIVICTLCLFWLIIGLFVVLRCYCVRQLVKNYDNFYQYVKCRSIHLLIYLRTLIIPLSATLPLLLWCLREGLLQPITYNIHEWLYICAQSSLRQFIISIYEYLCVWVHIVGLSLFFRFSLLSRVFPFSRNFILSPTKKEMII